MRLAVQPLDIGTRILPAHAHDWITVSLRMAGIFPSQLRILLPFEDGAAAAATITGRVSRLLSKRRVFATRDVILAQGERPQCDLMLRCFISNRVHTATVTRGPGFFLDRRAHGETASRENDHLRAGAAIAKDGGAWRCFRLRIEFLQNPFRALANPIALRLCVRP